VRRFHINNKKYFCLTAVTLISLFSTRLVYAIGDYDSSRASLQGIRKFSLYVAINDDEFYFEALREVVIKDGFKDRGSYQLFKQISKTDSYLISYSKKHEILGLNKLQYPNGWHLGVSFYKGYAITFSEAFLRREGNEWKTIYERDLKKREAIEKAERFISEVKNYGGFK